MIAGSMLKHWPFLQDGGLVTIDLIGTEQTGKTVFDRRDDLTFVLGEGAEINIPMGLELALEKVKKYEKVCAIGIRIRIFRVFGYMIVIHATRILIY